MTEIIAYYYPKSNVIRRNNQGHEWEDEKGIPLVPAESEVTSE